MIETITKTNYYYYLLGQSKKPQYNDILTDHAIHKQNKRKREEQRVGPGFTQVKFDTITRGHVSPHMLLPNQLRCKHNIDILSIFHIVFNKKNKSEPSPLKKLKTKN